MYCGHQPSDGAQAPVCLTGRIVARSSSSRKLCWMPRLIWPYFCLSLPYTFPGSSSSSVFLLLHFSFPSSSLKLGKVEHGGRRQDVWQ